MVVNKGITAVANYVIHVSHAITVANCEIVVVADCKVNVVAVVMFNSNVTIEVQ